MGLFFSKMKLKKYLTRCKKVENEDWKKQILGAKVKGKMPILKGEISEYKGKMKIALWPSEEFERYLIKVLKEC